MPLPRQPPMPRAPRPILRLTVGLSVALALVVSNGEKRPPQPVDAGQEEVPAPVELAPEVWTTDAEGPEVEPLRVGARGKPIPSKPMKEQRKAPCDVGGGQTEVNGGCWVQSIHKPPCPRTLYEYKAGCYVPVRASPKVPVSAEAVPRE